MDYPMTAFVIGLANTSFKMRGFHAQKKGFPYHISKAIMPITSAKAFLWAVCWGFIWYAHPKTGSSC
jgi:hypothetical protein